MAISVRLNTRSDRAQFCHAGSPWQDFDEHYTAKIRRAIVERFTYPTATGESPLLFGRDKWQEYIDSILSDRRIDPFQEWLEALPEWDGKPRLDGWLKCVLHHSGRIGHAGDLGRRLHAARADSANLQAGAQIGRNAGTDRAGLNRKVNSYSLRVTARISRLI